MNSSVFPFLLFFISAAAAFKFPQPPIKNPWLDFKNLSGCHLGENRQGVAHLKAYLCHFGYLPAEGRSNFTDSFDSILEAAIAAYQRNFRLDVTGELDAPTLEQLITPRCGVPDITNATSSALRGRNLYSYFDGAPTWPPAKTQLKYAITATSAVQIDIARLRVVFERAFARWSAVTTLAFEETESVPEADITIGFYRGSHGDEDDFDGPLGTLAHAFSPTDGRFHLDAAEAWVAEGDVADASSDEAVDLESVAVHEIGHLLGLGHSLAPEAIMYPTLRTRTKKVELTTDDVEGIQSLYGRNPNFREVSPSASSPETNAAAPVHGRTAAAAWTGRQVSCILAGIVIGLLLL
ncbi:metalloendoproteinase 2-MMP-like [Zingiber officinale]|uniref:Peptidase metallopeptidase domain-containing protein n=1 Tax=Zingiber officinale TaxID=94328 RepID=A0A8J5FSC0_ZINOF|nr:metalloendoproteinase 2-MMP-like [Zingiber officinale]KAG6494186.1 hypothetical protein ZIOFF_049205 [Zingiber officinale]